MKLAVEVDVPVLPIVLLVEIAVDVVIVIVEEVVECVLGQKNSHTIIDKTRIHKQEATIIILTTIPI